MNIDGLSNGFSFCGHVEEGACCFRFYNKGNTLCDILSDSTFKDGLCHFRKKRIDGPNLYDEMRKKDE